MKPSLTARFTIETELSAPETAGVCVVKSHRAGEKPHNRLRARPSRNLHHSVTTSAESRSGGEAGPAQLVHADQRSPGRRLAEITGCLRGDGGGGDAE